MRRHRPLASVLPPLLLLCGCATTADRRAPAPEYRSGVVSARDIESFAGRDVYELIRRSRPLWLRTRGPIGLADDTGIAVYRDGVLLGGLEQLRGMPVEGIASVVHYDGPRATLAFGTGHPHGVIQLVTSTTQALHGSRRR